VPNGVTDFQRSVAGQAFVAAAYHGDTFPRSSSSKRAIRAQHCGISLARVAARAFLREFPRFASDLRWRRDNEKRRRTKQTRFAQSCRAFATIPRPLPIQRDRGYIARNTPLQIGNGNWKWGSKMRVNAMRHFAELRERN